MLFIFTIVYTLCVLLYKSGFNVLSSTILGAFVVFNIYVDYKNKQIINIKNFLKK